MVKRSLSEAEEPKYYDNEEDDDEEDGEESEDEEVENGENEEEEEEVGERRERLKIRFSSKGFSSSRVCCQVADCGQDLGEAKLYYKKHKVCEHHSKAVVVSIDGIHQRFCQQCSRFHEISEFDDAKRSCRERLAGHNERRRKAIADLQAKEEGVDIASVSDIKDKSWRVRGHLEHLTMRVQGKPSY